MKVLFLFCIVVSVMVALVAAVTGLPYEWIAATAFIFALFMWTALVARVALQAARRPKPQPPLPALWNRTIHVTGEVVDDEPAALTQVRWPQIEAPRLMLPETRSDA